MRLTLSIRSTHALRLWLSYPCTVVCGNRRIRYRRYRWYPNMTASPRGTNNMSIVSLLSNISAATLSSADLHPSHNLATDLEEDSRSERHQWASPSFFFFMWRIEMDFNFDCLHDRVFIRLLKETRLEVYKQVLVSLRPIDEKCLRTLQFAVERST